MFCLSTRGGFPSESSFHLSFLVKFATRFLETDIVLAVHLPPVHFALLFSGIVKVAEVAICFQRNILNRLLVLLCLPVHIFELGHAP